MGSQFPTGYEVGRECILSHESEFTATGIWQLTSRPSYEDFAEHGTILVVSHGLEALQALCDRVIWIEDGVVRRMGAGKEVIPLYREAIEDKPVAALAAGF